MGIPKLGMVGESDSTLFRSVGPPPDGGIWGASTATVFVRVPSDATGTRIFRRIGSTAAGDFVAWGVEVGGAEVGKAEVPGTEVLAVGADVERARPVPGSQTNPAAASGLFGTASCGLPVDRLEVIGRLALYQTFQLSTASRSNKIVAKPAIVP